MAQQRSLRLAREMPSAAACAFIGAQELRSALLQQDVLLCERLLARIGVLVTALPQLRPDFLIGLPAIVPGCMYLLP